MVLCISFAAVISCSSSKKAVRSEPEKVSPSVVSAKKDSLTNEERNQLRKILNELRDIPFDFDKHVIPSQGLEIIKMDVALLNKMLEARGASLHITLEGNCDERGSDEYNLALGEKRANVVRDYLITVGFKASSLKTISFGEERPSILGHTQEAWAANRRVHLVVE